MKIMRYVCTYKISLTTSVLLVCPALSTVSIEIARTAENSKSILYLIRLTVRIIPPDTSPMQSRTISAMFSSPATRG